MPPDALRPGLPDCTEDLVQPALIPPADDPEAERGAGDMDIDRDRDTFQVFEGVDPRVVPEHPEPERADLVSPQEGEVPCLTSVGRVAVLLQSPEDGGAVIPAVGQEVSRVAAPFFVERDADRAPDGGVGPVFFREAVLLEVGDYLCIGGRVQCRRVEEVPGLRVLVGAPGALPECVGVPLVVDRDGEGEKEDVFTRADFDAGGRAVFGHVMVAEDAGRPEGGVEERGYLAPFFEINGYRHIIGSGGG